MPSSAVIRGNNSSSCSEATTVLQTPTRSRCSMISSAAENTTASIRRCQQPRRLTKSYKTAPRIGSNSNTRTSVLYGYPNKNEKVDNTIFFPTEEQGRKLIKTTPQIPSIQLGESIVGGDCICSSEGRRTRATQVVMSNSIFTMLDCWSASFEGTKSSSNSTLEPNVLERALVLPYLYQKLPQEQRHSPLQPKQMRTRVVRHGTTAAFSPKPSPTPAAGSSSPKPTTTGNHNNNYQFDEVQQQNFQPPFSPLPISISCVRHPLSKTNTIEDGETITKQQLESKRKKQQRQQQQRTIRISFDPYVSIYPIIPLIKLVDHPSELWYQEIELNQMKLQSTKLVDMVQAGLVSPEKRPCLRGLEVCMEEYSNLRLKRRQLAWNSVFEEQLRQKQQDLLQATYGDNNHSQTYKSSCCCIDERTVHESALKVDDSIKKNNGNNENENILKLADLYQLFTLTSQMEAIQRATQDAKDIASSMKRTRSTSSWL